MITTAKCFDVNRRSALATRLIGRSRAGLVKFAAVMNMPGPVEKKSFATHVSRIATVTEQVAKMQKAGRQIRREMLAGKDETIDRSVSCDGTWARRGFQSLYAMTSAIHVESGKVFDHQVKGKVCYKCRARKDQDPDSPEYIQWKHKHVPRCRIC